MIFDFLKKKKEPQNQSIEQSDSETTQEQVSNETYTEDDKVIENVLKLSREGSISWTLKSTDDFETKWSGLRTYGILSLYDTTDVLVTIKHFSPTYGWFNSYVETDGRPSFNEKDDPEYRNKLKNTVTITVEKSSPLENFPPTQKTLEVSNLDLLLDLIDFLDKRKAIYLDACSQL